VPEVRRVFDFDGRSSLHDVHEVMHEALSIGDDDHLYAFFLSGNYWDQATEYVDPRTTGARADQALLFRLRLRAGQRFVYVYDYGTEHRYSLDVVSVTEAEAPLLSPLLIESVGDAPKVLDEPEFDDDSDDDSEPDPALKEPLELAAAVLAQLDSLDDLAEDARTEERKPRLCALGEATLAFLLELDGSFQLLSAVDRAMEDELIGALFDVPARLSAALETELAVRVAEALKVYAPDAMNGEIAIAYAEAGDRDRALELVLTNLETAGNPYIAEYKAGDVYRELGEEDAAEAYYRRALAIAKAADRDEATLRVTTHLLDTGREAEAAAFVAQQRAASAPTKGAQAQPAAVGRNEPCPCGSGKKYKKCHGA
jgi:uncharacterized protein YchJ